MVWESPLRASVSRGRLRDTAPRPAGIWEFAPPPADDPVIDALVTNRKTHIIAQEPRSYSPGARLLPPSTSPRLGRSSPPLSCSESLEKPRAKREPREREDGFLKEDHSRMFVSQRDDAKRETKSLPLIERHHLNASTRLTRSGTSAELRMQRPVSDARRMASLSQVGADLVFPCVHQQLPWRRAPPFVNSELRWQKPETKRLRKCTPPPVRS